MAQLFHLPRIHLPMQGSQEMWVSSLGQEDLLEEEIATQSSILAWKTPMERETWQAAVHGVAFMS